MTMSTFTADYSNKGPWQKLRTQIFSWLLLVCLGAGCAVNIPPEDQVKTQDAAKLSPVEARQQLALLLERQTKKDWWPGFGEPRYPFKYFKVTFNGFEFDGIPDTGPFGPRVPVSMSFPYASIRNVEVMRFGEKGNVRFIVTTASRPEAGNRGWRADFRPEFAWEKMADAEAFAEAVTALGLHANGKGDLEAFKEKADSWRSLAVKPELPEEARKYRVLAENAYKEKRFEDARRYYEQGLEIQPLWPDGQFNAAILDKEFGDYGEAVYHMRCFIELAPESKDAAAARDQIIIWEEKAKEPSAASDSPQTSPALGRSRRGGAPFSGGQENK
jgi:tetratricopeptide (TPR) repeat protein